MGIAKTPQSSKTQLLDNMLSCNDYYAKLFTNELNENNPQFVEANFLGYNTILLNKDFWQEPKVESSLIISYYQNPVIWVSNSNTIQIIRGYYITNLSGNVLWYQKFPSPVSLSKNKAIDITIRAVLG